MARSDGGKERISKRWGGIPDDYLVVLLVHATLFDVDCSLIVQEPHIFTSSLLLDIYQYTELLSYEEVEEQGDWKVK